MVRLHLTDVSLSCVMITITEDSHSAGEPLKENKGSGRMFLSKVEDKNIRTSSSSDDVSTDLVMDRFKRL